MTNHNPKTAAEWTRAIKAQALALGFDKVGILDAEAARDGAFFRERSQKLESWLSKGYQAEMDWMAEHHDIRIDPASPKVMAGTKSIVCVAMNYFTPDTYNPEDPEALKIAKYARGTDYHDVLKKRLKQLLTWIQAIDPTVVGRPLTDSAPIMEKPLAELAGIGWQGKNGNLLTPDMGSFLFIGELLLSIELTPDIPQITASCGNCTRCIDACPTDAILYDDNSENPQYAVVDANRCISYWTIEYKGEQIPDAITQNMQGWIFGCDICQDVCPWNIKFATPTQEPLFQPRPWNIAPEAEELLALDEETFKTRYQKSPIKRPKIAGLKRNVTAVIKNKTV